MPVIALAFAACDEIEMSDAKPVENPQLDIFNANDLAISQDDLGVAAPIKLQSLADGNEMVKLAKVTKLENFPEDYALAFEAEVSTSSDYAKTQSLTVAVDDDRYVVAAPEDVEAAIKAFTNDPETLTLYARFKAFATNSSSTIQLGGPTDYYGEYAYQVTPMDAAVVMARSYALRYRTSADGQWQTMPFDKVNADASVYDNGEFEVSFEVATPGFEWTVQPVGTSEVWGVSQEGAAATSGALVATNGGAYTITTAGPYMLSIDVLKMTYKIDFALASLAVPINSSNWTPDIASAMRVSTSDYVNFTGTMRLYENWFLSGLPDNNIAYVDGGNMSTADGVTTGSIVLATALDENARKMTIDSNGLYYVEVNLASLTYKCTKISEIALIGSFNDWNLETALAFTPGTDAQVTKWTLEGANLKAGDEYKLCCNNGWTVNYGGSLDNIVLNGGNFNVAEDGVYDFEADFSVQPNVLRVTKK